MSNFTPLRSDEWVNSPEMLRVMASREERIAAAAKRCDAARTRLADKAKRDALATIKKATACFAQVRFGTSESWVRISKADARGLVRNSSNENTSVEMDERGDCYLS